MQKVSSFRARSDRALHGHGLLRGVATSFVRFAIASKAFAPLGQFTALPNQTGRIAIGQSVNVPATPGSTAFSIKKEGGPIRIGIGHKW